MADASFRITFAGPLVSFQDGGRFGHMRFGVPASGPMDRLAHAAANVALGNPADATAIEVSMGGLMLECRSGAATVAVAGGDFVVEHPGGKTRSWVVLILTAGDKLAIRAGASGSWAYLAVAGTSTAPHWLGHTATHSMSGLGGGQLSSGQEIVFRDVEVSEAREGGILRPDQITGAGPIEQARVVVGPQDRFFRAESLATFLESDYELTDAYDRMGVRLKGPALELSGALSIPSEPIIRGAIQVAGDGVPTLLLADHQTTGGYPKIATVISGDLDRVVQLRARDRLRFQPIDPAAAVAIARANAAACADYFATIAVPHGTLLQRLMRENLISGVVSGGASE